MTPLESDDPDFTAAEGEEDQPPDLRDGTVLLSRKRSSSLRDSMEREETVVQEADSTVNISEHQGHLGAEGDGEGRKEEEGEGGAKRARDASVLPELGVLKSLLEHTDPKLEVEKLGESDADQVITPPIPQELVKEGKGEWGGGWSSGR